MYVDHIIALDSALGSAGAWVTLPKEATPDGEVLRATTPEGVSPIGLVTLHLQTPGATRNSDPLAGSWLPRQVRVLTGTEGDCVDCFSCWECWG